MKLKSIFFFCVVLSLYSCCKDDDEDCIDPENPKCSNYDPCHDASEVTADFLIYESHASYYESWIPYDTDTLAPRNATFTAIEKGATYTWIIGSEILHDRTITRTQFPFKQSIPITLIVEKEPNRLCFPDDDGKDTLTRSIYVIDFDEKPLPIEGTFRGANADDPDNIFEVTINLRDTAASQVGNPLRTIKNLPNNCGEVIYFDFTNIGYKQFGFNANSGKSCNYPVGNAKVEGNDLVIDYTITVNQVSFGQDRVKKQFKGTRIN